MVRTNLLLTVLPLADVPALAQSQDAHQQPLTSFGGIDVNGDGVLTRADFRKLKFARWTQIDRNGDGYLSEDDFHSGAAERARTLLAKITFLDINGDGRISRDEFLDGLAPMFTQSAQDSDEVLGRGEIRMPES